MESSEEKVTPSPEQETSASSTSTSNEAGKKMVSLSNVEKVVNEYAKTLAKKNGVNPEFIEFHLAPNLNEILKVQGGHVVHIYLKWPEIQPRINLYLKDIFSLMRRLPIRRSMEIVPVAYVRKESIEVRKKWKKESFTEESDIVLDLVPKGRLMIQETVTTTLIDTVTKEKITIEHEGKLRRFDGENVAIWMQLSRFIRDQHPELNQDAIEEDKNE